MRRVLLQAAHQVGDRDVEVLLRHDGRVEQHLAHVALHGAGLGGRHALQHLDVERLGDVPLPGKQVRVGDVEQVVAGDADAQGVGPGRVEHGAHQADVVRVDVGLARVRCLLPAVQLGLDLLHREVRALDQADLEPRTAVGDPAPGDRGDLLERRGGVGQVGLQHDPGLLVPDLRVGDERVEHPDGEGEVAVLLHVEVEERAVPRRRPVQRTQPLDDAPHAALGVPGGQLAGDRGHLDRDVVDVGPGHQLRHAAQPAVRLLLAEHGLAEQVEVQPEAVGARAGDVAGQAGPGVGDEVPDQLAQPDARRGHDGGGQHRRDAGAHTQQHPVHDAEEPGGVGGALAQPRELGGGDGRVLRAGDPVDEPHGELEPDGVGDERGQPSGRAPLGGGLVGGGRVHPRVRQVDGAAGEVVRYRGTGCGGGCGVVGGRHPGIVPDRPETRLAPILRPGDPDR